MIEVADLRQGECLAINFRVEVEPRTQGIPRCLEEYITNRETGLNKTKTTGQDQTRKFPKEIQRTSFKSRPDHLIIWTCTLGQSYL